MERCYLFETAEGMTEKDATIEVSGLGKALDRLRLGERVGVLPPKARFRVDPDGGKKLGDRLANDEGLVIASRALRDLIAEHCGDAVELLPIPVNDSKGKPVPGEYFLANPLVTWDCLDLGASDIEWSPDALDTIDEVTGPVIDRAKTKGAPNMFRLPQQPELIVIAYPLAFPIHERKLANVGWVKLMFTDEVPEQAARKSSIKKCPLTVAAQEGDLRKVKRFIAQGARLNGEGNAWYTHNYPDLTSGYEGPMYLPLGEAARFGHLEVCRALLKAGAQVDAVNYVGDTALIGAVKQDHLEVLPVLLEAGANIDHVSDYGTVLHVAASSANAKLLKALLAHGASARVPDRKGRSPVDKVLHFVSRMGQYRESAREQAKTKAQAATALKALLPVLEGGELDKAKEALTALTGEVAEVEAKERKAGQAIAELASAAAIARKDWPAKVRALMKPLPKGVDAVEQVCAQILTAPAAIAHPEWPKLVKEVVALSQSYSDAAEACYGKRLPISKMDDDEGSTLSYYADEHLYTFDFVLNALSTKAAVAHPKWAQLVKDVCAAKYERIRTQSFGDDEVDALLGKAYVRKHPAFSGLVAAARKSFPYARCFGAKGKLRSA